MATDKEREAAIRAFDGSLAGGAALAPRLAAAKMLQQDRQVLGVAVLCMNALMQVEVEQRAMVIEWLKSEMDG